jgi:fluoroquinolone transport system permease protein
MRLADTILNDIRFQARYGFYLLYAVMTAVYAGVLLLVPERWRDLVASIVILSDPAMLGFFFIGGIWLLERGEGVQRFLVVSPMRPAEYVAGKAVSLSLISTLSAFALMLVSRRAPTSIPPALVGVFVASAVFTVLGLFAATFARTVNNYLLIGVPAEILIVAPVVLFALFPRIPGISAFPGAMLWRVLISPAASPSAGAACAFAGLAVWFCVAFSLSLLRVPRALAGEGGIN